MSTLFEMEPLPDDPFARSSYPPSPLERRVAALIWQHKGRRNPVPIAYLMKWVTLSERSVKSTVEKLRREHLCPIGARRAEPVGYFVIVDAADEDEALESYRRQMISEARTVRALASKLKRLELAGQVRLAMCGPEEET